MSTTIQGDVVSLTVVIRDATGPRLKYFYVQGHQHYAVPVMDYITLTQRIGYEISNTPPRSTTPVLGPCEIGENVWNPLWNPPDQPVSDEAATGEPPTPVEVPLILFPNRGE